MSDRDFLKDKVSLTALVSNDETQALKQNFEFCKPVTAAVNLIASQDFPDENSGDVNMIFFSYNKMCQHLKDLQCFPNNQCMMLENQVSVKDPFRYKINQ